MSREDELRAQVEFVALSIRLQVDHQRVTAGTLEQKPSDSYPVILSSGGGVLRAVVANKSEINNMRRIDQGSEWPSVRSAVPKPILLPVSCLAATVQLPAAHQPVFRSGECRPGLAGQPTPSGLWRESRLRTPGAKTAPG